MARETCPMMRDHIGCEALPIIRLKSSLQALRTDSQRLAMVTIRNHCLKRHRLEHPLMVGQGVVIGYQYSDGIGKSRSDRNVGLRNNPQSPITSLAKSQALAYRWNLRQVENETSMNLGTIYDFPDVYGHRNRCLRPISYMGRSLRSSPREGKPLTWRRETVKSQCKLQELNTYEEDV
jgi:hypothetical protein